MSRLISGAAGVFVATALVSAAGGQVVPKQPASTTVRTLPRTTATRSVRGAGSTIQGNALTSTNGQMTNAMVRLRDARFGTIVDTQMTDRSGMFVFRGLDPGNYVVEVMGNDSSVLAASQLLSVNAGDAVSAVVKLPFRIPPFVSMMGTNSTPTAAAVATQAATNGVVAVVATRPVSPVQ